MSCARCDSFDTTVELHSPAQLAAVIKSLRAAVEAKTLLCESLESAQELKSQPAFTELSACEPWPDVMRYRFSCPACEAPYILEAETYHGSGGSWRPVSSSPFNRPLHPTAFGIG
jgi:hypothetical protein